MSKKLWSMSTTLRSPYRAKDFLKVLKLMEGQEWTNDNQKFYQTLLIKYRFYMPTETNLTSNQIDLLSNATIDMTTKQARDIFDSKCYNDPAMRGRTSFDPLEKLGLVQIVDNKIKITQQGNMLLNNEIDPSEMQFKSLLKLQYPNPLSNDFKSIDGFDIKPFVAVLHLINEVNKICREKQLKEKGISKEEFGIFALSLINFHDINKHAYELINYRLAKEKLSTREEQKKYYENYVATYLSEYSNASLKNIKDYSDNAIRYFRQTKYLYIRGGGYYVDLEPRRKLELSALLNKDNGSSLNLNKEKYKEYIGDYNKYTLPWETLEQLSQVRNDIIKEINNLNNLLGKEQSKYSMLNNIEQMKHSIDTLREERTMLQNLKLKQEFADISKIDEAIYALSNINALPEKPSIALEKWTNIALNILNDSLKIKPNCPVGDDNEPTFTAPANVADIECYYSNYEGICEVTMLTGRNQWFNEGQPVQRHLRDFEERNNNNLPKYCIFISPRIHRDTINTFWNAIKYEFEGSKQKIVPINISQLIILLQTVKELKQAGKKFTHDMLKSLYDSVLDISNYVSSMDWILNIQNLITKWKKQCI